MATMRQCVSSTSKTKVDFVVSWLRPKIAGTFRALTGFDDALHVGGLGSPGLSQWQMTFAHQATKANHKQNPFIKS